MDIRKGDPVPAHLEPRAQPGRREIPLDEWVEALRSATIDSVEVEPMGEYIVIKVGQLTLYADEPTLYGPEV